MDGMALPRLLRLARHEAGLTQDEVGAAVGLTGNGYGKIESGKRGISMDLLGPLCRLLDVSVDEAMGLGIYSDARRGGCAAGIDHCKEGFRMEGMFSGMGLYGAMSARIGDILTRYPDVVGHIILEDVPEGDGAAASLAGKLLADSLMSAGPAGTGGPISVWSRVRNPAVVFRNNAKEGLFDDAPDEEFAALVGIASRKGRFWCDQEMARVSDLFKAMVVLAGDDDLEELRRDIAEERRLSDEAARRRMAGHGPDAKEDP